MRLFAPEEYDVIIGRLSVIGQPAINATSSENLAQEFDLIGAELSGADEWVIRSENTIADDEGTAIFGQAKNPSIYQLGSGTTISIGVSSDTQTSTKENQRFDLDETRSVFYSIGEDDDFILQREHSDIIAKYLDHLPRWIRDLIFNPQSSIESAFRPLVFIGEGLRSRFNMEALDILCLALSHHAPYLRHGSIMAYLAWDDPVIIKILSDHRKSETSPGLCRLIDRVLKRLSA